VITRTVALLAGDQNDLFGRLGRFRSGSLDDDKQAAQAATWFLTDKMSWEKLQEKKIERVGGVEDDPYFSEAELNAARQIVARAQGQARKRDAGKGESTSSKGRVLEKKI
jgi:hypothetical protein